MQSSATIYLCQKTQGFELNEPVELSVEDQGRLQQMSSEGKKAEFLTSRIILNKILTKYYNLNVNQVSKHKNGKPYLKDTKISFSLSHSADYFAFAFAEEPLQVGVDIETNG